VSGFGKAKVKIRKVDRITRSGRSRSRDCFKHSESLQDDLELEEDLCNAYDRKGTMVIEKGHACAMEGISSHAKQWTWDRFYRGPPADERREDLQRPLLRPSSPSLRSQFKDSLLAGKCPQAAPFRACLKGLP